MQRPMKFRVRGAPFAAGVVLGGLLVPGYSYAEAWQVSPFARLMQEYDDNARLTVTDEESLGTTVATGGLDIRRETEISSVSAEASLSAVRYSDDSDRFDDTVEGRLGVGAEQRGERSAYGIDGSLTRESITKTTPVLVEIDGVTVTPDDALDEGIVNVNVERTRLDARPWLSYSITPRSDVGAFYRHRQAEYDQDVGSLTDYTNQTLGGTWSYKTSEITTVSTTLEASQLEADRTGQESDYYQARIGLTHRLSEISEGGLELGYYQADWDDGADDNDDGVTAALSYEKRGWQNVFSGRLARSISPSGVGDLLQSDEALLAVRRDMTERFSLSARVRAFRTEALNEEQATTDRRYIAFEPGFRWALTRWWAVEGGYRYRRQEREGDSDTAESNSVFVALRYAFPEPI